MIPLVFKLFLCPHALAAPVGDFQGTTENDHFTENSEVISGFVDALESMQTTPPQRLLRAPINSARSLWITAFKERGIAPDFLLKRMHHAKSAGIWSSAIRNHQFLYVRPTSDQDRIAAPLTVSLRMPRLDVVEDFDDVLNDNLFVYSVSTYQDVTWGRTSAVYRNLDEGTSLIFSPEDQPLFDPKGYFHTLSAPIFIDFGIVETDGEDAEQMARLTSVIVDLARDALTLTTPNRERLAARAAAETENLMRFVVSLDSNDRLATGTLRLDPLTATSMTAAQGFSEWSQSFSGNRNGSDFAYRLWFRMIRERTDR